MNFDQQRKFAIDFRHAIEGLRHMIDDDSQMSDDLCCQVLAWVYGYGGGCEATVYNVKFNAAIKHAQDRLGIHGGSSPDYKMFDVLKYYLSQMEIALVPEGTRKTMEKGKYANWKHPDWAYEICDRYEIDKNYVR